MPFLVAFPFLAAASLGAEKPSYFRLPQLLTGSSQRPQAEGVGADRATCSPAGLCEWAPAPRPPDGKRPPPPGRADSHWLDVVISSIATARREEAFFWPKNNTRVSPGTSLLHPLPSIVSCSTIPGSAQPGGGRTCPEEISSVIPQVIGLPFPGWARVLEAANGQTDQACLNGSQIPMPGRGAASRVRPLAGGPTPSRCPHRITACPGCKGLLRPSAHQPITQTRKVRPRKIKVLPNF